MRAFLPLLLAALAPLLVAALGFTERSLIGTALEDRFYGFFFRAYPLFLFAIVYGVARIAVVGAAPGPRRAVRGVGALAGLALFLLACLYPTFGGLVLRPGYMTGGMSFLQGQSATVATLLGAGAAAMVFGLALGVAEALAGWRMAFSRRALGRGLVRALMRFLALWTGAAILLAPAWAGLDPVGRWPQVPLPLPGAAGVAGWVALALLPDALLTGWRARRRSAG